MNLKLFKLLGTRSRRAILSVTDKNANPYDYRPRADLVNRLALQTRMKPDNVVKQLHIERRWMLKQDKA